MPRWRPSPGSRGQFVVAWYSTPLGPRHPVAARAVRAELDPRRHARLPEVRPEHRGQGRPGRGVSVAATAQGAPHEVQGPFLLSVGPTFFPELPAVFVAEATTSGPKLTLALQAVDQNVAARDRRADPDGRPIRRAPGTVEREGTVHHRLRGPRHSLRGVPARARPGDGGAGITFLLRGFRLDGVTTSGDAFCGNVSGDVVVQGEGIIPPNTRLLFEGSTFGASRDQVITACAAAP